MGGNFQDSTPEWKEFCDKVAREALERKSRGEPPETFDAHEEWRRLNLGTDR
jgi:hypothetical protein